MTATATHLLLIVLSLHLSCCLQIGAAPPPTSEALNAEQPEYFNPKVGNPSSVISKQQVGVQSSVDVRYHMGPVLSSSINVNIIWYGVWTLPQKQVLKDFILSLSASHRAAPFPSVSDWWSTATLYNDQSGANVSRSIIITHEFDDNRYSQSKHLTRISMNHVIANAIKAAPNRVDDKNAIFLIFSSDDVTVQDFCRAVCGFHYFTFRSIVGHTVPYAWIGNSGKQCPDQCAYPFAVPAYMNGGGPGKLLPPNGNVGLDGMVNIIGHELAEMSTNPLINAWYEGDDPTAPTEIADLCQGLYGTGAGSGYIGQVMKDRRGTTYNLYGRGRRKFMVQWIFNPILKTCTGPHVKH